MNSDQEVSFRQLVTSATPADLRALINPSAVELLLRLRPEVLTGDRLIRLVTGSGNVRDFLLDPNRRPHVFNLLSMSQARLLGARLDLASSGDAHAVLRNASESLSSNQLDSVLAFFGADENANSGKAVFAPPTRAAVASYSLFSHQRDAMRRVQERLYTGSRRVILHMPTGAGKTRTAMNIVAEHLRDPRMYCCCLACVQRRAS